MRRERCRTRWLLQQHSRRSWQSGEDKVSETCRDMDLLLLQSVTPGVLRHVLTKL
jgi:hypothetical protein